MSYIGKTTDGFGVRDRFVYVVSGGATSVSGADANGATLKFTDGAYVDVYLNGVLLKAGTDYNTNTANTIAGIASMSASDEVTVIVYDVFTVADTVSAASGGTFSGGVTFSSSLDMNGGELILDADADSSIRSSTDDQIDFKAGNIIRASVVSTGLQIGGTAYFASPTLTLKDPDSGVGAGTVGGKIDFHTMDGTSAGVSATMKAKYEDANGNTSLVFDTGSGGSTSEKVKISSTGNITTNGTNDIIKTDGFLKVSNAFAFHGSTDNYSNVDGQQFHELNNSQGNEFILMLKNTNAGTDQHGLYIDHASGDTDNGTAHFMSCVNTAARFHIRGNGNVQNHDNSYGSISDERIKQDIVDAKSQWNDIKAIKIRNYKKKDDIRDYGDKAWLQIGVIAQELETVSPYLIEENKPSKSDILSSNEFGTLYTSDDAETKEVLYKDGDTIPEGSKVGDVKTPATKVVGDVKEIKEQIKSVKYSVLYMKAIKALQEAMTRIETLEAKVKALEEA